MEKCRWAKGIEAKIQEKMLPVAVRSIDKIPYRTENGRFDDYTERDIFWWTNGFWGGMMWQLYHAFGEPVYRNAAEKNEEKLVQNLMHYRGMDHDSGFKWLLTAAANYRLTGSEKSLDRTLIAANSLAGRFNLKGSFIRAWNDDGDGSNAGIAIIDCMMNLPLLYFASEKLHDPRFRQIAAAHADMAANVFVRPDGSVNHIVEFDPETGAVIGSHGGQGYEKGSSWTRGQAWALYGFVLSYLHTGEGRYLDTAKRVANYFIANTAGSWIVPVDFRQPKESSYEDSTAAAIAACGLLEIAKQVPENEKHVYEQAALHLLQKLEERCLNWDPEADYLLDKCTAAYHDKEHEFTIIYGDYFFIEAILKLTGKESFMW